MSKHHSTQYPTLFALHYCHILCIDSASLEYTISFPTSPGVQIDREIEGELCYYTLLSSNIKRLNDLQEAHTTVQMKRKNRSDAQTATDAELCIVCSLN